MASYISLERFGALTLAPASYIAIVEADEPGWCAAQLDAVSALVDARLAKRYATPFSTSSPPIAVELWVSRIMTLRLYLKRGVDATDGQYNTIREDETAAWAEIKEAADSNTGLYELPLRADDATIGVSKGGPLGYSETSPYTWTTKQREAGRDEDSNR